MSETDARAALNVIDPTGALRAALLGFYTAIRNARRAEYDPAMLFELMMGHCDKEAGRELRNPADAIQ